MQDVPCSGVSTRTSQHRRTRVNILSCIDAARCRVRQGIRASG